MKKHLLFCCLFTMMLFASCSDYVTTGDATEIPYRKALITGKVDLANTEGVNLTMGILYSTEPRVLLGAAKESLADSLEADFSFSAETDFLKPATTYYYRSYLLKNGKPFYGKTESFTTSPVGPVDMGLSVKWGECNIGANSPEEYGDYYAWGETITRISNMPNSYSFLDVSNNNVSKYCTKSFWGKFDNKAVLEIDDDVAAQSLGNNWRIPTIKEWEELKSNCIWLWNSGGYYVVTSKTTGNSIILPAAGLRYGEIPSKEGYVGAYWSSSVYTEQPVYARYMFFEPGGASKDICFRFYGLSVRPVCD